MPVVSKAKAERTLKAVKRNVEHLNLVCGECGGRMLLKVNRLQGRLFWLCSNGPVCPGAHGAHPDGTPLGVPADTATRAARRLAHDQFDKLWKAGVFTRTGAYAWLRHAMNLSVTEAHIGRFTKAQCEKLIQIVRRARGEGP